MGIFTRLQKKTQILKWEALVSIVGEETTISVIITQSPTLIQGVDVVDGINKIVFMIVTSSLVGRTRDW